MSEFPLGYKIIPTVSWAYLSSLLMIALYFKFNRIWSVRNLDLLLIILLAPGLLTVAAGTTQRISAAKEYHVLKSALSDESVSIEEAGTSVVSTAKPTEAQLGAAKQTYEETLLTLRTGYILLFVAAGLFAIRMLIDPMMVRRPLLEPNMSFGGLTFLGVSLLLFLIINVITSKPSQEDLHGPRAFKNLVDRKSTESGDEERINHGPGYGPFFAVPALAAFAVEQLDETPEFSDAELAEEKRNVLIAKIMAILCQLAVVGGLFYIGYRHFENARMGVGIAVLYLMLPYTAEMTGNVKHILPAALLVWAIAFYRRPWLSGLFTGAAMGVFYYPFFLLPLWVSFYWKRGRWRFLSGVMVMVGVLSLSLIFVSTSPSDYLTRLTNMFGVFSPRMNGLTGIWEKELEWDSIYRLPILASFVVVSIAFVIWPAQKNLGTLICCSCALMAIVQFWHGFGGGLLMGWYLPLGLLTIFRPNLEDRVALTSLARPRKKRKSNGSTDVRPAA